MFVDSVDTLVACQTFEFIDAPLFNVAGCFDGEGVISEFASFLEGFNSGTFSKLISKQRLLNILVAFMRDGKGLESQDSLVQKILRYVELNVQTVSANSLQQHFGYHKNYINYLIKAQTGKTLGEVIRHAKIERAKAMIVETNLAPTEVAVELGYYDYSHFFKAFKQETGVNPSEYLQ